MYKRVTCYNYLPDYLKRVDFKFEIPPFIRYHKFQNWFKDSNIIE